MKLYITTGLLLLALSGGAVAAPEDVANDISRQVMSPYCPGVTLHDCPSAAAIELRAQIAEWATAGWSEDRIMDRLVAEYGETIRAVPPTEGAGLLAWVLPAAGLAAAIGIGVYVLRRFGPREAPQKEDAVAVSADERARLTAELDARRSGA